jgi:RimJ/RimL family protein N-acetyltransferase
MELLTPSLLLRRWRPEDREPFARLNADPRVMESFPACLTREESDREIERFGAHFELHGFGIWAVERRNAPGCLSCMGLRVTTLPAPFTPGVEILWKLAAEYWGQGLASEGAREVLRYGFGPLALGEIVAFTIAGNVRSRRVMEKIGLRHSPAEDFDHPNLPVAHPLRRHMLDRAKRDRWLQE